MEAIFSSGTKTIEMKNVSLLLGVFLVICTQLEVNWAQNVVYTGEPPCNGLLYMKSELFRSYPNFDLNSFYNSYIQSNYKGSEKFLCPKSTQMLKFETFENLPDRTSYRLFMDGKLIVIDLVFEQKSFTFNVNAFEENYYGLNKSIIADSMGHEIYGSIESDSIVDVLFIKSIILKVNGLQISEFNGGVAQYIINPNRFYQYKGINPIEVYYSMQHERVFIYISGEVKGKSLQNLDSSDAALTYLAKFIINPKSRDSILVNIIPGGFLGTYGWLECDEENENIWKF